MIKIKQGMGRIKVVGLLLATTVFLTGCGGGNGGAGVFAEQSPGECEALKDLAGPNAGTGSSHGTPQRSDGAVSIGSSGGMVTASRLVTIVNDFGGATQAQVDVSTPNGSVVACPRSGGYGLKLMLQSRAATEVDARKGLDSITISHSDTLATSLLKLNTIVQFGSLDSGSTLPGGATAGSSQIQRSAAVVAGLPATASYDIAPSAANGLVRVSGLSGSAADLSTTNGDVSLNGRWDSATLKSTNGLASVSGDYASLSASTTNGLAEGDLSSSRKLDASFASTNGSVDVKLRSSDAGFDLTASTSNARANINVPNTVAVGTQSDSSVHHQTTDYASRAVQAQIKASSTNGSVEIRQ